MTHKIYRSQSVDARLVVQKRRLHGRQRNARRYWKLRDVTILLPGAFGSDRLLAERQVGRLKTFRCGR